MGRPARSERCEISPSAIPTARFDGPLVENLSASPRRRRRPVAERPEIPEPSAAACTVRRNEEDAGGLPGAERHVPVPMFRQQAGAREK